MVGRLLSELTGFIFFMTMIYFIYKWCKFKYDRMVREDKTDYYERHGLDIEKDDN